MRALQVIAVAVIMGAMGFAFQISRHETKNLYPNPLKNPPAVFTQSVATAKIYWAARGRTVPCGNIAIVILRRIPSLHPNSSVAATSDHVCRIVIRQDWYDYARHRRAEFCTAIVHEVGHIIGLRFSGPDPIHSPVIGNIMYPSLSSITTPKECQ